MEISGIVGARCVLPQAPLYMALIVPSKVQVPTRQGHLNQPQQDFPGGTVLKNLPSNAGDEGSIPGSERSHVRQGNS